MNLYVLFAFSGSFFCHLFLFFTLILFMNVLFSVVVLKINLLTYLLTLLSAIPLSRFSLKMSRLFLRISSWKKCALCALFSVKWNSDDSATNFQCSAKLIRFAESATSRPTYNRAGDVAGAYVCMYVSHVLDRKLLQRLMSPSPKSQVMFAPAFS